MSTILDALRRLEQDKEKAKKPTNVLHTVLHSDPDLEGQIRTDGKRTRVGIIAAGVLVVALAIVVTFWVARSTVPGQKASVENSAPGGQVSTIPAGSEAVQISSIQPQPSRTAVPAASAVVEIPETYLRSFPGTSAPSSDQPSSRRASAIAAPEVLPMSSSRVSTSSADLPSPPGITPVVAPEVLPGSASGPSASSSGLSPSPRVPPSAGSTKEPVRTASRVQEFKGRKTKPVVPYSLPKKKAKKQTAAHNRPVERPQKREPVIRTAGSEAGIRISAIVWSSNPEKRFAIVNLKTVYAGDLVGGRKVVSIREEAVVFEEFGDKFQVKMGNR